MIFLSLECVQPSFRAIGVARKGIENPRAAWRDKVFGESFTGAASMSIGWYCNFALFRNAAFTSSQYGWHKQTSGNDGIYEVGLGVPDGFAYWSIDVCWRIPKNRLTLPCSSDG